MSAHDDELPGARSANGTASAARLPSSRKVPFGIDKTVVVNELRQLADALEAGDAFPQELVRTQRDAATEFKMFTLAVTFASPAPPSES